MAAQGFFTRMTHYRWTFEPVLSLMLGIGWGSAALVVGAQSSLLTIGLFATAVALTRFFPVAALIVGAVATLATVTSTPFGQPAVIALLFTAGCLITWGACLFGRPIVRYLALAVALLIGSLLTGYGVVLITAPFGPGPDDVLRFLVVLGSRLTVGLLATTILVGGWVAGFLVRGRSDGRAIAPAPPGGSGRAVFRDAATWLSIAPGPDSPNGPALFLGRAGFRALSRRTLGIDAGIAGVFFLFGLLVDPREGPPSLLVLVGFTAALAVRRLSPGLALVFAWIAALAQMLLGQPVLGSNIAVLAVLYVTAAYGERVVRWAGLVSVGVGAMLSAGYLAVGQRGASDLGEAVAQGNPGGLVWSFVFALVASLAVLGLSWTLGLLMRIWKTAREGRLTQHRAVEEQRTTQRAVVVEQERNRIARDMHDVVAHSLAVVIAQADGARYARAENPDAVDEALSTISATARHALGDVRILLTRLRRDVADGPQPVLADLDRLVSQMRGTGLDIEWTTTGTPTALGTGAQLAVYRIVQEALTNALRHGDTDRTVCLSLAWTDGWVVVRIDNAVRLSPAADASGELGHGLPGMRERALLAGGYLSAESRDGLFIVSARLPAITSAALVSATTLGTGAQS